MAIPVKPPRATIDFESRSTIKLKKQGTLRYATSPTTDVLVMAYRLPYWKTGRTEIWTPEYPTLGIMEQGGNWDALMELFDWIQAGGLVEAHNAWFERNMWRHIMVSRYGWPEMPKRNWRCSAAQAAACALPRGLDDALAAVRLSLRKDAPGEKVMKKMMKPRKARKAERKAWQEKHGDTPIETLYWETPELLQDLYRYVRQDVLAEEALSYMLPDLSDDELEMFWLDQDINDRGFQLDMEAVNAALELISVETTKLNGELELLTGGAVTRATQRDRMKAWLLTEGCSLPNTQAATLDGILETWNPAWHGSDKAKRAIEILRVLGRSSTSKYEAMRLQADLTDGRLRGGLLYHGASTGRWTGVGVQPHNFPKGTLKALKDETPNTFVERLWDAIKTRDRDFILDEFKASILEVLSHGLRSAIIAPEGKELFVADFASIEARVVLWLAGDEEALEVFRLGKDIYLYTAEGIYKRPLTKADTTERQMGKQAVLGLGFQMGAPKFVDTVAKYGITIVEDNYCDDCGNSVKGHRKQNHPFVCDEPADITAVQVVDAYREKYWRTVELWKAQEDAAITCVKTKRSVECGKVVWHYRYNFLWCELPSGRELAYAYPTVSMQQTAWGSQKETLQFKGVNPKTKQWQTQKTYGGMIVENITQAVARDLIAEAIMRLEKHPVYEPVLSVHDEALAEAPTGLGSVEEFEHIVAEVPDWAYGLPVAAEAWSGVRYRK